MSISIQYAIRHKFYALRSTPLSSLLSSPLSSLFTLHSSLFLFLLAVYLLTYTPRINSSDGLAMFATAESLARRGAVDIEQIRWLGLQQGNYGLDGLLYSPRKGIGLPLVLLPLTWLGLVIPWLGTVSVSLLFNALVTALTAALLLAYLQELGFNQLTSLIVSLTFGLTTLAWPYAKSLFSDPFSGLLLLAAAYFLLKIKRRADFSPPRLWLYLFLAGFCLGWNVLTRYAEAIFLPVYGLLFLYYLRFTIDHSPRSGSKGDLRLKIHHSQFTIYPLLAFLTPILLLGIIQMTINISFYGNPFNTGYMNSPGESFSAVWWQGIIGQLVSPGRGLLLYCPVLLLSFVGFPLALRRFRAEALLAVSIIAIHLLLYGKWYVWHGGYAWGPRFMIPTLPFWAILLAPVVEQTFCQNFKINAKTQSRKDAKDKIFKNSLRLCALAPLRLKIIFITLAVLGLIPQLLSVAIDFAPFQNSLLADGRPLFAPETFFDPHYSPFIRAWSFITPTSLDLAWAWQGQFNGWLLAALVTNVVINGVRLAKQVAGSRVTGSKVTGKVAGNRVADEELQATTSPSTPLQQPPNHPTTQPPNHLTTLLTLLSTLLALLSLLCYTHTLPPLPLQQAVNVLNEAARPADAIITNDPEIAMPFAELYKGRAPVLGLNNGGFPLPADISRRLADTLTTHRQVWWLPNWLPPQDSAIEQTLLATGFRARNDTFAGQRLALFAFPVQLTGQLATSQVNFGNEITLNQVNYQPTASPGTAFPIELRWQAAGQVAENYHIFIHLLSNSGQVIAQADGQPALWTRPTSTWRPGEVIVDRYALWLPPPTPPGDYHMLIGLYRPADNQRLHLSDGQDAVELPVTIR